MKKSFFTACIIIAVCIGIGIGYYMTPEYADSMESRASGMVELGKADRSVDLRFIDGMIAHHLSAIYLSKQAIRESKRPEIITRAQTIITADEKGISQLYQWKKSWYGNTRPVSRYTKVQLGSYDDTFDLRFLNAMIAHHDEALAVAGEIRTKSVRTEVLSLADGILTALEEDGAKLRFWRTQWYQVQ